MCRVCLISCVVRCVVCVSAFGILLRFLKNWDHIDIIYPLHVLSKGVYCLYSVHCMFCVLCVGGVVVCDVV